MPLVPEYQAMFDQLAMEEPLPPLSEMTPDQGRELYRAMRPVDPSLTIGLVENRVIPGPAGDIPVRVYRPGDAGTPLPVYVHFHGGGWVIGDVDVCDAACRDIAQTAGYVVLSVDYRLAPEHVFPAAANDCYAAVKWAAENVDILGGNGRLAVGGESAGGNLAAVVCQMARDEASPKIGFQLLLYPVVDCDMSRQSYIDNAKDYILTTDSMHWFWNHYCPEQSARQHPRASPLRGELSGLPPALVVTAEFDPLRDEGAAYADALKAAGNDTRYVCYAGLVHDFFAQAQTFHACREAFDACCAELKRRLT